MKPKKKFISDPRLKYLQRTNPRLDEKDALPLEDDTSPVLKEIQQLDNLINESFINKR